MWMWTFFTMNTLDRRISNLWLGSPEPTVKRLVFRSARDGLLWQVVSHTRDRALFDIGDFPLD
jgi:hypothetical protein